MTLSRPCDCYESGEGTIQCKMPNGIGCPLRALQPAPLIGLNGRPLVASPKEDAVSDESRLTWRKDGLASPYDAAIRKGREARKRGEGRGTCPYHERNATNRFGIAPARTWRIAWLLGFDAQASEGTSSAE